MKRKQHPLDQLLKQKLDTRSFEYQDAYWEAASELLGDQGKKRRGFWVWMLLAFGLVSGTMGWAMFSPAPEFLPDSVYAHMVWNSDWEFPDSCLMAQAIAEEQHDLNESSIAFGGEERRKTRRSTYRETDTHSTVDSLHNQFSSQEIYNTLAKPESQRVIDWEEQIEVAGMMRRNYSLKHSLLTSFFWKAPGDWKRNRHSLGLTVGTQLAPAWRGEQTGQPSIAPVVGAYYRYALSPTVRLQTGILYQQRSNLNRDTTFTSLEFGFGRTENSTTLSSKSLHFASLPITAEFAIGNRQSISIGVEPSVLIGVRTNVENVLNAEGQTNRTEPETTWNYPQGYRNWDVSLQAGYHYYLGQGLRIGTVASYGLRDLTDNAYFTQGWIDRQLNWRIWVEYDLKTFGSK